MINLIQISNPLVLAASLSIIPITILHRARNRSFAFFTFCTEELARLPCSIPRRRREPNAAEPTGEPPREILEPRLPLTLLLQFGQDLAMGTISATRILSRRRRVRISTMRGSSIRGIVLFPSARLRQSSLMPYPSHRTRLRLPPPPGPHPPPSCRLLRWEAPPCVGFSFFHRPELRLTSLPLLLPCRNSTEAFPTAVTPFTARNMPCSDEISPSPPPRLLMCVRSRWCCPGPVSAL
jgi:hypothetical protein